MAQGKVTSTVNATMVQAYREIGEQGYGRISMKAQIVVCNSSSRVKDGSKRNNSIILKECAVRSFLRL